MKRRDFIVGSAAVLLLAAAPALAYVPGETKLAAPGGDPRIDVSQAILKKIAADVTSIVRTAAEVLPSERVEAAVKNALSVYFQKLIDERVIVEVFLRVDFALDTFVEAYIRVDELDEGYGHIWMGEKPAPIEPRREKKKIKQGTGLKVECLNACPVHTGVANIPRECPINFIAFT